MAVATAHAIRVRFLAATLHLQTCTDREERSSKELQVLISMLASCARLKQGEQQHLMSIVVSASTDTWSPSDRSKLLEAIEMTAMKRRRDSQNWLDNCCHVFTAREWDSWKEAKAVAMDSTAHEMISRLKAIGAKNLDEHTKKRLIAVWLYLRGDGRILGAAGRGVAGAYFKNKLARVVREFEPDVYVERLPTMAEFKENYPHLYNRAYTSDDPPHVLNNAECIEIQLLDSLMSCRGQSFSSVGSLDNTSFGIAPHQQQASQQFSQQQVSLAHMMQMNQMMLGMHQHGGFNGATCAPDQYAPIPSLEIFSSSPHRVGAQPMRGMSIACRSPANQDVLRNSIEPGSIANQAGGSAADGSAGHLALVDATPAGVLAGQVPGGSATGTIAADLDAVKRKMLQRGKVENFDADDDKSGDSVGEEVPEKRRRN
jgi:hypothetical protein